MKKILMILTLLFAGIAASGQQYTGRKVTAIDSVVTDTIRARTQAGVWIQGLQQTDPAGNNTEIQFNDNGVFGASSDLTWNGTGLSVANGDFFADGDSVIINNLKFRGSSIESSNNTLFIERLDILDMREQVTAGEKYFILGEAGAYFRLGNNGIDYNEDGNYAFWRTGGTNDTTYQLTIEGSDYSITNAPLKVTTFQNNSGTDLGSNRQYLQRFYNGSTLLQTWEDDGSIDFESNALTDIGSLTVDGLFIDGTTIEDASATGGFNLRSNGSLTLDFDYSGGGEVGDVFRVRDAGVTILDFTNLNNYWDFEGNDVKGIGSLTVDNLTLDGNDISSSTGTVDVTGNATFSGEIDVDGSFVDLGNGGTNGRSALLSSTASSAVYLSNVNTGTAPFDQKGSVIIQPRSDAAGRSVAIATGSGGSEAVAMLIDDSQNATFSGDVQIGTTTTEPVATFLTTKQSIVGGTELGKLSWSANDNTSGRVQEEGAYVKYRSRGTWNATLSPALISFGILGDNNIFYDDVFTIDEDQNATFSGDVSLTNVLNSATSALRLSGGSTTTTGGSIQLNHNASATPSDIIFRIEGNEVGRYDSSQTRWEFDDVAISGSLSKGSGTFKITHPLDTGKWLYHSFVEAPRADNIYRGQVELYRGIARVRIDTASNMMAGTFEALNQNVQVFVTNNDTWDRVRGYYSNGIIYIECQNELSRAVVDWLVIGERKDQTVIDWNLTDENGQLIPEWNKDND